jgi:hypothetical protein
MCVFFVCVCVCCVLFHVNFSLAASIDFCGHHYRLWGLAVVEGAAEEERKETKTIVCMCMSMCVCMCVCLVVALFISFLYSCFFASRSLASKQTYSFLRGMSILLNKHTHTHNHTNYPPTTLHPSTHTPLHIHTHTHTTNLDIHMIKISHTIRDKVSDKGTKPCREGTHPSDRVAGVWVCL